MADQLQRAHPLSGRLVSNAGVTVEPAPEARRMILRAGKPALPALSKALGVKLPAKPKGSANGNGRIAIWLGPDEWLVIDLRSGDPAADCAAVKAGHSAVDVSHRNTAITVSGAQSDAVINGGCPLDLSLAAFPVGAATRTVFGKAEIVLLREAEDRFRIECWRSFSDYVFGFLEAAAADTDN